MHLILDYVLNRCSIPNRIYGVNVRAKVYSEMEKGLTPEIAKDVLGFAVKCAQFEGEDIQDLLNPVIGQWQEKITQSLR